MFFQKNQDKNNQSEKIYFMFNFPIFMLMTFNIFRSFCAFLSGFIETRVNKALLYVKLQKILFLDVMFTTFKIITASLTSTKPLPGGHNFQFPLRSRPSLRSTNIRSNITNERSKSQANITKVINNKY